MSTVLQCPWTTRCLQYPSSTFPLGDSNDHASWHLQSDTDECRHTTILSHLPQLYGHRSALPPLVNARPNHGSRSSDDNNMSLPAPLENVTAPASNNIAFSSQVHSNPILTHPRLVNTPTQEIEEALEIMRETRTKITILKDIKVMVFNDKFAKKFILICPQNLIKTFLDIRYPFNPQVGNYVLVMNLTVTNPTFSLKNTSREISLINPPHRNQAMNLIIWNYRGANGQEFWRNFRSLDDWHKPTFVALLVCRIISYFSMTFLLTKSLKSQRLGMLVGWP